jgi:hypothetical protein
LMTNPVKFPERQRRTQIMQKQRLRKEYFHWAAAYTQII